MKLYDVDSDVDMSENRRREIAIVIGPNNDRQTTDCTLICIDKIATWIQLSLDNVHDF